MNVPLSLSIALVLLSCYGNVSSDDEEEATTQPSYTESTTDPDYDYNSTFEYYYVTNNSSYSDSDEISPESTTPRLDVRRIVFVSDSSSCRSITDRSLLTSSLLLSLAALFH